MANKPTMNMPEILVFAKPLVIGFIVAEIWRVAFYLGTNFAPILSDVPPLIMIGGILFVVLLCLTYGYKRGAHTSTIRVSKSFRLDLLLAIGTGIWINVMVSPWLAKPHEALKNADPYWAPAILLMLCTMLLSPLIQDFWARSKKIPRHQYFISDEAIGKKVRIYSRVKHKLSYLRKLFLIVEPTQVLSLGLMGHGELARQAL